MSMADSGPWWMAYPLPFDFQSEALGGAGVHAGRMQGEDVRAVEIATLAMPD